MHIDLTKKEFRLLLDLAYIGNWVLNSTRGENRFAPYDDIESKLFAMCRHNGMDVLVEKWNDIDVPSKAYCEGGIHEAIMDYEDTSFFEILAEELARKDMDDEMVNPDDIEDLAQRMDEYMLDFEENGLTKIYYEK